jgi:hypothetical protein
MLFIFFADGDLANLSRNELKRLFKGIEWTECLATQVWHQFVSIVHCGSPVFGIVAGKSADRAAGHRATKGLGEQAPPAPDVSGENLYSQCQTTNLRVQDIMSRLMSSGFYCINISMAWVYAMTMGN